MFRATTVVSSGVVLKRMPSTPHPRQGFHSSLLGLANVLEDGVLVDRLIALLTFLRSVAVTDPPSHTGPIESDTPEGPRLEPLDAERQLQITWRVHLGFHVEQESSKAP